MEFYKTYQNKQLKSKFDTFDFSQTLKQQVNNDFWKQKSSLWRIVSAACNDAASQYYIKIRQYVKNLADVDVCTIHNLKSMAKSVDAEHLLDFTDSIENFPVQLRQLMDILSIKPSKLMQMNQKLHYSSLFPFYGNIDNRSCLIRPDKISNILLIDILNNLDKFQKLFEYNNILKDLNFKYLAEHGSADDRTTDNFKEESKLFYPDLTDNSDIFYFNDQDELADADSIDNYELTSSKLSVMINELTVEDIFKNIQYIKDLKSFTETDIHKETQLSQLLGFEFKYNKAATTIEKYITDTFSTPSLVVQSNGRFILNPFFALIEIVKGRVFISTNTPFLTYYKDKGQNEVKIDMSDICENMISLIKKNNYCYVYNFIAFHLYNLFQNKIINDTIRDDFKVSINLNSTTDTKIEEVTYVSKYSEMTLDEFKEAVSNFISNNELKEFLGEEISEESKQITEFKEVEGEKIYISHYKQEYIDFIRYLALVNVLTNNENDQSLRLPFLLYRYNNTTVNDQNLIGDKFNFYYRRLLGINEDGTYNEYNLITKVTNYLTDICLKVSYIRQELKALIQQYSFIGTQRIITDVVRDYYIKNFSKRSSWNYISDIFKNKDNSNHLKTLQNLNGVQSDKFGAQIIQYYDQTNYLNIQTDLPPAVNGYRNVTTSFISTYLAEVDIVSSYKLTSDLTSTNMDDLGLLIPSSLYPSSSITSTLTIPAIQISGTSLYGQLIQTVEKQQVESVVPTKYVITTYIDSSKTYNNRTRYVQTYPTTSVITDANKKAYLKNYCKENLGMNDTLFEQVFGNSEIYINITNPNDVEGIDIGGNTYYSVFAQASEGYGLSTLTKYSPTVMNTSFTSTPISSTIFQMPAQTVFTLQPEQTFSGVFYNPAASSVTVPKGTEVSTIIPQGTVISTQITSTIQVPIYVDGKDLVNKSNTRFWQKNIEYLSWQDLSAQISFYSKYFPNLQNALTEKLKIKVYKEEVYPLLSQIWSTYATSGLANEDETLNDYYRKFPGNETYLTIAPLPYIPNLVQVNTYQNDDSYIVKPLYDNIAYYMNMFMRQMFNMYKTQSDTGFAVAIDGWKQTHIQMKGYCSRYERSANTLATEGQMNPKLDFDGPWVYSSLKAFLNLREDKHISLKKIREYVDDYYFNLKTDEQKENEIRKLNRYQKEIFDIKEWKLYSFEADLNDNQFSLFKRNDYFKYEDVGQIWVRMKNFPLSIPLMNKRILVDFEKTKTEADPFNVLMFNDSSKYSNMFSQLANNAVQFGVIKNVMWILGWTNYVNNFNDRLVYNESDKVLKLVSFKFKQNNNFNLVINPLTIKSYHIVKQKDSLNNFNQFVGVNYKERTNSIDFVLFDIEDKNQSFKVFNYKIDEEDVDEYTLNFNYIQKPALKIEQITALVDTNIPYDNFELGQSYYKINNDYYEIGTVYQDDSSNLILTGFIGKKENTNESIFTQQLIKIDSFNYPISSLDFNQYTSLYNLDSKESITTIIGYSNIWRLGADEENTGIAYEAYNMELTGSLSALQQEESNYREVKKFNLNNILTYDCELLTKQVIDSDNNIVYMNQIKNIKTDIISTVIYSDTENHNELISLYERFPYCYLNNKNHLLISSLVTTLGGYKNLTLQKNEKDFYEYGGYNLLNNTINYKSLYDDTDEETNCVEQLITNPTINYFVRDQYKITLDDQLEPYKEVFNGRITGQYNFYEYYDKYIEAKEKGLPVSTQQNYLQMYNQQMAKLNDVVAFAPVVNEFIVEPLKIIFNFGNIFGFKNTELTANNYFDLDVNMYIDSDQERHKKVGWKCSEWQTDYISWISRDERFGGPEIAIVDVDKYKDAFITYNNMNFKDFTLDIIINVCWFMQTQIQSLNPNIFINWKGFNYNYIIEDIETNEGCCDLPFLKVKVGLNNNTLRCYRRVLLPTAVYNKHTKEKLFGFIRKWQDELKDLYTDNNKIYISTEDYDVDIDVSHPVKSYIKFEELCNNPETAREMLNLVNIYDYSQSQNLTNTLTWNTVMKIKMNNEQIDFHVKKIIL